MSSEDSMRLEKTAIALDGFDPELIARQTVS